MPESERIRETVPGVLPAEVLESRRAAGYRLAAVEWERISPSPSAPGTPLLDVPYGLRVAADHAHLEEEPSEVQVLLAVLKGIARDQPLSVVAADLNQSGSRMRTGEHWTQSAVFQLLPRLIDFGPRLFTHPLRPLS
jgi:hypothetical protein